MVEIDAIGSAVNAELPPAKLDLFWHERQAIELAVGVERGADFGFRANLHPLSAPEAAARVSFLPRGSADRSFDLDVCGCRIGHRRIPLWANGAPAMKYRIEIDDERQPSFRICGLQRL
jgi:hypothetical protein